MAANTPSSMLASAWMPVVFALAAVACSLPPIRHSATLAETEHLLSETKAGLMSADYRADLAALSRLRERVIPLEKNASLGYLAHYWAGFASWRLALNGVNHRMRGAELKANLERAAAEFDASIRSKDDFADAYAAAASVNGWLGTFYAGQPEVARDYWGKTRLLLARAEQLEPNNPRVLWVRAGDLLAKPVEFGGSPEQAVATYRRVLAVDQPAAAGVSPLPDWGRAEAFMALAYAHLNQEKPDLTSAETEARQALRLQPDWSYVRDNLLPQIATRKKELEAASLKKGR